MNHQKHFADCHSDPHHRRAGPPRNQGAMRRSRFKVSFGAPPVASFLAKLWTAPGSPSCPPDPQTQRWLHISERRPNL